MNDWFFFWLMDDFSDDDALGFLILTGLFVLIPLAMFLIKIATILFSFFIILVTVAFTSYYCALGLFRLGQRLGAWLCETALPALRKKRRARARAARRGLPE